MLVDDVTMNVDGFESYRARNANGVPTRERDLYRVRLDDVELGARVAIVLEEENTGRMRRIGGQWTRKENGMDIYERCAECGMPLEDSQGDTFCRGCGRPIPDTEEPAIARNAGQS